jgi:hypothetical protein
MDLSAYFAAQGRFPPFMWQLSEVDRFRYSRLKNSLLSRMDGSERNHRIASFTRMLDEICAFAIQGDKDDSLRSIVCGVCWLPDGLGITRAVCAS